MLRTRRNRHQKRSKPLPTDKDPFESRTHQRCCFTLHLLIRTSPSAHILIVRMSRRACCLLLLLLILLPVSAQVQQLVAGGAYTCAHLTNGSTFCWGKNSGGQLGIGTSSSVSSPVPITLPDASSKIVAIAVGDGHSCVILNLGVYLFMLDNVLCRSGGRRSFRVSVCAVVDMLLRRACACSRARVSVPVSVCTCAFVCLHVYM